MSHHTGFVILVLLALACMVLFSRAWVLRALDERDQRIYRNIIVLINTQLAEISLKVAIMEANDGCNGDFLNKGGEETREAGKGVKQEGRRARIDRDKYVLKGKSPYKAKF